MVYREFVLSSESPLHLKDKNKLGASTEKNQHKKDQVEENLIDLSFNMSRLDCRSNDSLLRF